MRFKIDWASLIVRNKFIVFALFYFVFEGNFPSTSPRGAYIWRGDLTEGFLRYRFGGLIYFEGLIYFRDFPVSYLTQLNEINWNFEKALETETDAQISILRILKHKFMNW